MLTCVIRNDLYGFLAADRLAVKAMLAVFNIFKNGLFVFLIPPDNIYEAGLIAELTANAFFR